MDGMQDGSRGRRGSHTAGEPGCALRTTACSAGQVPITPKPRLHGALGAAKGAARPLNLALPRDPYSILAFQP